MSSVSMFNKRKKARLLRSRGQSIREIATKVGVSPSGVYKWVKNITLTKMQQYTLEKRRVDPNNKKRKDALNKRKILFQKMVTNLKHQGIREVGKLIKREIFLIGIALYWGEGFKKDNLVGFANTDPLMLKFFINWLQICFNIKNKDLIIRVTININYKYKIDSTESYWSKQLNIPLSQFSKPFFQNSIQKKRYNNPDNYHGVLRIKVRKSVNLLRKIYGYIEGISSQIL